MAKPWERYNTPQASEGAAPSLKPWEKRRPAAVENEPVPGNPPGVMDPEDPWERAAAEANRERTWGETASDLGTTLMGAFAQAGRNLNELSRYTPGGAFQTLLDEQFDTGTVADVIDETTLRPATDRWRSYASPQLQQMRKELGAAEGLGGTVDTLIDNPALVGDIAVEQIPNLLLQLGIVGKATPVVQGALGMATEAAQAGGEAGTSIRDAVAEIPDEVLLQHSPEFRELVAEHGMEGARKRLVNSLATQGTATSAVVTGLLSRLLGDTSRLQSAVAGDAVGGLSGLLRRTGMETVSEGIQESAEGAATDFALQRADQRIDPLDVDARLKDAVLGSVMGAVQGGGMNTVQALRAKVRSDLERAGVTTQDLTDEALDAELQLYIDAAEEAGAGATPEQILAAVEANTGTDTAPAETNPEVRGRRQSELAAVFEENAPVNRREDMDFDPETGEGTLPENAIPVQDRSGTTLTADQLANQRQVERLLEDQNIQPDVESVRRLSSYLEQGLSPREAINAFRRAARAGEFRVVPLERDATARERREQFAGEAFDLADVRRRRYEADGRNDRFPRDTRAGRSPADMQPGVGPQDPNNPWLPSGQEIDQRLAEGRLSEQEANQLRDLRDYVDAGMMSEQEGRQRAMQVLFPNEAASPRMRQDLEQNSRRVPQGVNEGQPGQPRNSVDRISTTQPGGLAGEFQQAQPEAPAPAGPRQGRDVTEQFPQLPNRMAPTADDQNTPRMENQGAATADNQRPDQSRRAPVRAGEQVTAYRPDGTPVRVTVQNVWDNGDVEVRHQDGSEQMIGDELSLQRPQNPQSGAAEQEQGGQVVTETEQTPAGAPPAAGPDTERGATFRSPEQQADNLKSGRELIDQQLQGRPLAQMGLTPEQWDAVVNEITERQTDAVTGWLDARGGTMKHDAFLAARDAARETGKPVVFVGMDIANLGGLNAYYNDVAEDANREYRAITDIVLERLASLGYTLEIRTGGDELGVFIHNVTESEAQDAMDAASAAVIDHAQAQGYGNIEHGKTKEPGFGVKLHWATVPVNVDSTDSSVYGEADRRMKQKPTGDDDAATQQPEPSAPQPGPPDAAAAEPAPESGRQGGGDVLPEGEAEAGAPSLAKVPKKLLRLVDDYGDPRSIPLERIPEAQRQLLRDLGLVRTSRAVEGEREIVFTNVLFDEMRRRGMEPTGPSLLARPGLEDRLAVTDKQLDDMSPTRLEFLGERMGFPPRITQNYDTLLNTLKNEHPDDIEAALEQLAEDEAEAAAEAEETRRNDPPLDEVVDNIGRDPEREAREAAAQERAQNREAADRANEARQRVTTPEGLTYDAGSDGTVVTPGGKDIEYTWALVDPADLKVSHDPQTGNVNPDYPAELQPRERSRAASTEWVRNVASNLDTRLLQDSNTTAEGAPIVGPDGVVESGNGRMMAIQRSTRYDAALLSLRDKGLAGTNAAGKVLVRVRKTPLSPQERVDFTRNSNDDTKLGMSTTERAKVDADKIQPIIGQYQGGDVTSPLNREFVRAFMARAVSPEDRATFLQENGTVSADGRRRMQAAVFQAAYGDSELVAEVFESTDTDIKAIGNALLDAAGWWGEMRERVRQPGGNPDLDLTENLLEAVRLVQRARQSRQSLKELLDQGDMVSGEVDPMTRKMVEVLYHAPNLKRARGQKAVAKALSWYAMDASQRGASIDMFGEVSPEEVLEQGIQEAQAETRRNGGGGEPDTQGPRAQVNVKFYSGIPLDALADAIKKVIGLETEAFRRAGEMMGQLIENSKEAMGGLRAENRNSKRSILTDAWRVVFATVDGDMRVIAGKFNSPTLKGLADKFHATAGSDAGVGQTFDEAVQARNKRLQVVDQIVSMIRDVHTSAQKAGSKMTYAERENQIIRMVENKKIPRRGPMGALAKRIELFLAEELQYMRDAGVEVGEVKDGYFPREPDMGKVNARKDKFITQATKAYQEMGYSRDDAIELARAYMESILHGSSGRPGVKSRGSDTPKFTQERVFTKKAAAHLEEFYLRDVDQVLGQYTMRATKRAEIARRFGDNWADWENIEKQILEEDPEAINVLPAIKDLVALSAGVRIDNAAQGVRYTLSIMRTWTTLATLPKSAMASVGELVIAPLRGSTGNIPSDVAAHLLNIMDHGRNMARWMASKVSNIEGRSEALQSLFEMAEDIGIIAGTGHNSLMAARFAGGDPIGRAQSTILAEFFKRNLLEHLTNYTRVTTMRVGQTFVRRLSIQMESNPKKAGVFLRELGVPRGKEADFAAWVRTLPALPTKADLQGPYAGIYRNAMQRFTDQTVQRPSNSTRPKWAVSHPLGAMVFQLQAFGYAFQKNVINRTVRTATNPELSKLDRLAYSASTLMGFALLVALQGAVRYWRDEIYNPDINDRKTTGAFVEGALSQAGLFGVADPYLQSISGVRYQKDIMQSLTGPALGGLGDAASDFLASQLANSPNTNTAERNWNKSMYDWVLEPIQQALLTAVPGGPLTGPARSFATIYAVPAGREPFVDAVAGEATQRARTAPIQGALEFIFNGAANSGDDKGRGRSRSSRNTSRSSRDTGR